MSIRMKQIKMIISAMLLLIAVSAYRVWSLHYLPSSARSVQNVRLVCMLCICIPFMGDINLQPRHAEEYADLALFGSRCDAVRSHDAISAGHLLV